MKEFESTVRGKRLSCRQKVANGEGTNSIPAVHSQSSPRGRRKVFSSLPIREPGRITGSRSFHVKHFEYSPLNPKERELLSIRLAQTPTATTPGGARTSPSAAPRRSGGHTVASASRAKSLHTNGQTYVALYSDAESKVRFRRGLSANFAKGRRFCFLLSSAKICAICGSLSLCLLFLRQN